jgi:Protein of unknown function (DUF4256)
MAVTKNTKKKADKVDYSSLLKTLQARFEKNSKRHKGVEWPDVRKKLETNPGKCRSLQEMEDTGGEPDVVDQDKKTGEFIFMDCSPESPAGRRSFCYDREALNARKEFKPANNVIDMATEMGIELLNESQYRALQQLGKFDTKTSSWILTPDPVRKLGGALFCDRRYDQVFVYHNGVQSYYAARGFRGLLKV